MVVLRGLRGDALRAVDRVVGVDVDGFLRASMMTCLPVMTVGWGAVSCEWSSAMSCMILPYVMTSSVMTEEREGRPFAALGLRLSVACRRPHVVCRRP